MEKDFWFNKWQNRQISFHAPEVNKHLVKNLPLLNVKKGERLFIPLCGKTLDIAWLLEQGYQIVGVELVETAIIELFDALAISPQVSTSGKLTVYSADNITIFVGDIFDLVKEQLPAISAVYDRAAFVALPAKQLLQYTQQIVHLSNNAKQLLITFEYDQAIMQGPPFSHNLQSIAEYYETYYQIEKIYTKTLAGGLKNQAATESVWILN